MCLSKDEVALSVDLGKAHHMSLTATLKKRTHASRTSCLPSTIAGLKAPGKDMPPLCGPLTHCWGRPREACSWVRTHWSLDSLQGQPPGGPHCLPSASRRSKPPADGGVVHTSREVGLLNSWDLNNPMGKWPNGETCPKGKWPKGESVGPH